MWDLIVSVSDHCLSFYFGLTLIFRSEEEVCFIRFGLSRELELLMPYFIIMVVYYHLGYFLKITMSGQCSWNMKACWQL